VVVDLDRRAEIRFALSQWDRWGAGVGVERAHHKQATGADREQQPALLRRAAHGDGVVWAQVRLRRVDDLAGFRVDELRCAAGEVQQRGLAAGQDEACLARCRGMGPGLPAVRRDPDQVAGALVEDPDPAFVVDR
jgi:hypothetical protein